MTVSEPFRSFALGAVICLLLPGALPAQGKQQTAEELKQRVEQRERELATAQEALSLARARLAMAEGKRALAAVEWRKVVVFREDRLKEVQEKYIRGRICFPEPFQEATGAVAIARAWLAEAEGNRNDALAALPKVIVYYEAKAQRYRTLHLRKAITEKEEQEGVSEFAEELRWARQRLAALRGEPDVQ